MKIIRKYDADTSIKEGQIPFSKRKISTLSDTENTGKETLHVTIMTIRSSHSN